MKRVSIPYRISGLVLLALGAAALVGPPLASRCAECAAGQPRSWASFWVLATRNSLLLALGVTAAAGLIGVPVGVVSALGRRSAGVGVSRLVEFAGSLPSLILVILLRFWDSTGGVAALGLTLASLRTLEVAQVVRTETLAGLRLPHVQAARAMGASRRWQLRTHVLPASKRAILGHLVSSATWVVGLEAALGFVGLGLGESVPSWGSALRVGRAEAGDALFVVGALTIVGASVALHGLAVGLATEPLEAELGSGARRE